MLSFLALLPLLFPVVLAQYTPETAPDKTQEGQTGTNKCGTQSSQDSMCQNAYINSVTDFCVWAPPSNSSDYGTSAVGNTERIMVAWCLQEGHGTRVIPAGAITGAHFVKTSNYVQITGVGDFTKLNIPAGDDGGELDPHGADGNGNPIGGLVFSSAFGNGVQQITEWTNFMSSNVFSFRACVGAGAEDYCQHIYDVMGAAWNAPGDYNTGFDNCAGDSAEKPGVYGGPTFHQGEPQTPPAHPAAPTSQCTPVSTIGAAAKATANATSSAPATSMAAPSASTQALSLNSASPSVRASATAASQTGAARRSTSLVYALELVAAGVIVSLVA